MIITGADATHYTTNLKSFSVWRIILVLTLAAILSPHALFAAPVVNNNVAQLITVTDLAPTGVDANARGKINVAISQKGATSTQQVKIQAVNLNPNTVYGLIAYFGDSSVATAITTFSTDKKGALDLTYEKKSIGKLSPHSLPLPSLLDPMCNVRELSIVTWIQINPTLLVRNLNQSVVLRGFLSNPSRGSYVVNRSLDNPGFLPSARGGIVFHAGTQKTEFWLAATGLTPRTVYNLMINGEIVRAMTSDKSGGLALTKLPLWVPDVLDIHMVALTDGSGTNIVLAAAGLGIPCDITAPTVTSTSPANLTTNAPVDSLLVATFSELMDPTTITNTTFILQQGGTTVGGAVNYNNGVATFAPATVLIADSLYTATITTGVKSLSGYAMATNFVWTFITSGTIGDITAPTVSSTTPADTATNVAINSQLTATFSEAMAPATLTNTTFTLQQGGTTVTGVVSYASGTATFVPATNLLANSIYTATITTGVTDLASNALATNFVWTFTTVAAPDTTAPTVSSSTPANAAAGVPINDFITATFSEAMNPRTITNTTFTLSQNDSPVLGTVSYVGGTATFAPTVDLITNTLYTATITTGATDLASNALAANYVWTFTSGATPDTTAPTVSSSTPLDTATNVPINSQLTATFSEAMDPASITNTTFTLQQGVTSVTGLVSYVNGTATFVPTTVLLTNVLYTATVTTGTIDLAGNALATNFVWSFTTGNSSDTNPPIVVSSNPTNTSANVAVNQTINATFNKSMNAFTISTANFTVTGPDSTNIAGTVGYLTADNIASFTPAKNLLPNTTYTNTILKAVKDQAGNKLATNYVWTFTTGTQTNVNRVAIPLGAASTFAVMATGSTSGNADHINGDIGLNPGTSQGITGIINGTIHVTDQAVKDAQASLLAAYNEAVNRSVNAQTLEGNLGGLTKYPGLYANGGSSGISGTGPNAILTLDAQGDANAVFVFKMASTLITDTGTSIVLAGGAQAKNVFWQVGSSATLNSGSIFKGNILANVSIEVDSATVDGRIFAGAGPGGAGSVTVQASTITVPAP